VTMFGLEGNVVAIEDLLRSGTSEVASGTARRRLLGFLKPVGLLLGLTACSAPAFAEFRGPVLCGTTALRGRIEIAKHRLFSARALENPTRALRQGPSLTVEGDLVVATDDGTLVSEANPFDLKDRSLVFERTIAGGYRSRRRTDVIEPSLGDVVAIGDDATLVYDLSFPFPFYGGSQYRRLYLNSDGNLTFERGDSASTARSLDRFMGGPPRIALLFADLDPSEGGQVRVANLPDRFIATWSAVPEWGEELPNTFQIELRPNGSISMRYGRTVNAGEGIVGVSPGAVELDLELVDLSANAWEARGALAERFQEGAVVDNVGLARTFYQFFADRYDALVVWTNFDSDTDNAFAFASPVRNDVEGIGEDVYDRGSSWGSASELESFVFMGDLSNYPRDPRVAVLGAASQPTTLGLLSHEVGHRWLAHALLSVDGVPPNALLGRQQSHWSFFFDSDASFLEGNEIEPIGERRFWTTETVARYSRLDLYLMGLAPASEVSSLFFVQNASVFDPSHPIDAESAPSVGVTFAGDRRDVTIDDIERALGPRHPDFEASQKTFRHAWILLTRRNGVATPGQIAQLGEARNAFAAFFNEQTLGRAALVNDVAP
jgi:hypothetical protein